MNNLNLKSLSAELQAAVNGLTATTGLEQTGVVTRVSDGVAWIYGLRDCTFSELIEIEVDGATHAQAFVLNLMEDEIGAVLLGSEALVRAGAKVRLTGKSLSVPVGEELLGRVVDPLGRPLDGGSAIKAKHRSPIERTAPSVIERQSVVEPLATGILAIDTMIPIGRGQRELIIGDRGTGKTAIAVDAIINQSKQQTGVVTIYVAIGQKLSKVASLVERLKASGALATSIVVATSPADPAAMLYIAPYAATAMGEYFRDGGQHALIVYDDLSKHAVAYRQLSLLLRRPPGREAYPGDVFYLHSRLLERSAKLSDELGGGSLTALPIIETQAGDVGAYIPTNVISITDGQIYLETDLFYQGVRPAVSVGLSVSRVGGAAQTKAVKSVAGGLRLELAQFRELAAFTQFASDLDDETKARINRGRLLTEILKQPQFSPLSFADQVITVTAATDGAFDNLATANLNEAMQSLRTKLATSHPKLLVELEAGTKPSTETLATITEAAKAIAKTYQTEGIA